MQDLLYCWYNTVCKSNTGTDIAAPGGTALLLISGTYPVWSSGEEVMSLLERVFGVTILPSSCAANPSGEHDQRFQQAGARQLLATTLSLPHFPLPKIWAFKQLLQHEGRDYSEVHMPRQLLLQGWNGMDKLKLLLVETSSHQQGRKRLWRKKWIWIFQDKEPKHWALAWPCSHTKGSTLTSLVKKPLCISLKSPTNPDTLKTARGWSYSSTWPFPHTWTRNNYWIGMNHCIQASTLLHANYQTPRLAVGWNSQ